MWRTVFIILVSAHGAIHLLGFFKAFDLKEISELSSSISKPTGLLWLLSVLLFGATLVLFFSNHELWWSVALVAIVISQILIFLHWKDAKVGSLANLIILAYVISAFGSYRFEHMVQTEIGSFMKNTSGQESEVLRQPIESLPGPVQYWLENSQAENMNSARSMTLSQEGRLRLQPESDWMEFNAEQYFSCTEPGFIWNADVGTGSLIHFSGRDKFIDLKGEMLIKLFSLIPVADARGEYIDEGAAMRYLAEMIWFPQTATSDFLKWEEIDERRSRVSLDVNGSPVFGDYIFDEEGQVLGFEAERFNDLTGKREPWIINVDTSSVKTFQGVAVPTRAKVTWGLAEGDFTWLELEVKDIDYK